MKKKSKNNKFFIVLLSIFLILFISILALIFIGYKTGVISNEERGLIRSSIVKANKITKEEYNSAEFQLGSPCEEIIFAQLSESFQIERSEQLELNTCTSFPTDKGTFYWIDWVKSPLIPHNPAVEDAHGQLLIFQSLDGEYSIVLKESYDYPSIQSLNVKGDGKSIVVAVIGWESIEDYLKIQGK